MMFWNLFFYPWFFFHSSKWLKFSFVFILVGATISAISIIRSKKSLNNCSWIRVPSYVFRCYGRIPFCLLKFSGTPKLDPSFLPQRNAVPKAILYWWPTFLGYLRSRVFYLTIWAAMTMALPKKYTSNQTVEFSKRILLFFLPFPFPKKQLYISFYFLYRPKFPPRKPSSPWLHPIFFSQPTFTSWAHQEKQHRSCGSLRRHTPEGGRLDDGGVDFRGRWP